MCLGRDGGIASWNMAGGYGGKGFGNWHASSSCLELSKYLITILREKSHCEETSSRAVSRNILAGTARCWKSIHVLSSPTGAASSIITSISGTPIAEFLSLHSRSLNRGFVSKMLPGPELRYKSFQERKLSLKIFIY